MKTITRVTAVVAALLFAAPPPAYAAGRPATPPSYAQEFNGTRADVLSDGWRTGWFGDGQLTRPVTAHETVLHDADMFTVSGGVARLSARPNAEKKILAGVPAKPNLGSMINTDPEQAGGARTFSYGYVEARLWLPGGKSEGVWPAWWLTGQTWPDDVEVDVLEANGSQYGNCWNVHHNIGGTYGNLNSKRHCAYVDGSISGWHTYAADIRPNGITWYYDGKSVGSFVGAVPDRERYLLLNMSATGTLTRERTMQVDYVRVWRK